MLSKRLVGAVFFKRLCQRTNAKTPALWYLAFLAPIVLSAVSLFRLGLSLSLAFPLGYSLGGKAW